MAKALIFKANDAGIQQLLKSDGVKADLQARADRVASAARGGAPVESGEYVDGIEAVVVEHPTRAVGQVIAKAPHSARVEANTGNLARALDAAGG
jgi:hypothetical protein